MTNSGSWLLTYDFYDDVPEADKRKVRNKLHLTGFKYKHDGASEMADSESALVLVYRSLEALGKLAECRWLKRMNLVKTVGGNKDVIVIVRNHTSDDTRHDLLKKCDIG